MSTIIEAKFDDLHVTLQEELKKAKISVKIAVAWISFKHYKDLFLDLVRKGVSIEILCADTYSNRRQERAIQELQSNGVPVSLYKLPRYNNYMHHKFAIIDEAVVINGSFNWSTNASKNIENLIIIRRDRELVRAFMLEYSKIQSLDSNAIKSLQAIRKCGEHDCNGILANILVICGRPMEMTYEHWGDLIEVCSECGEESYKVLVNAIQDPTLFSYLSAYEFWEENNGSDDKYRFDRRFDEYLTGYRIDSYIIHAIGIADHEQVGEREDRWFTKIVWWNKFAAKHVRDEYDTDFNVDYGWR